MDSISIHALTMPKWGLAMNEARIVAWLVEEGSRIGPGTEVVDIETDKIASGLEPLQEGILRRKVAAVGETIPVGGLIAVIADTSVPESDVDSFVEEFRSHFVIRPTDGDAGGPAPQVIETPACRLRYLKQGEGNVPALLLHGFGGDLNSWLLNHEALASGREVYALDFPGHGGSGRPGDFSSISEFKGIVSAFLDALGIPRVHLVGHSMGGAIALDFAGTFPERVASLTLIATAGLGEEIDGQYINGFISATRRKDLKPVLEKLFAEPSLAGKQLIDDVLKFKRMDGVEDSLRAIANGFCPGGKQALVLRDTLNQLPMPVMVISGSEDRIIPPDHLGGLPPRVTAHTIPGSGHMVHMEAAPKVNRLIESFWESVGVNSPALSATRQ